MRLAVLILLGQSISAHPGPTYLGLYMQNHKIGYASYKSAQTFFHGKPAQLSDTKTVMDTGLLGTPMHISISSSTYTDLKGAPLSMSFVTESQGRTQKVDATFLSSSVDVLVNNSGTQSHTTLNLPAGPVVDDPLEIVLHGKASSGKCFILDPTTVSFIENSVKILGKKTETIHGKPMEETIVDIQDPRATTRMYLAPDGELIRAEGPMGILMIPESEASALAPPLKYDPAVDLAYSTSIVPKGHIDNPAATTELKIELEGRDLSATPSDEHQTVQKSARGWIIDVHPPGLPTKGTIENARSLRNQWCKPDLDMPSDDPQFRQLAKKIVGGRKNVVEAALTIKNWVYDAMRPNAGIGVLRDATEVLKTKEGVCRDYAILTGTLLRSAGIPTRLASGLVTWDGTFYYHAWDEVWTGREWIGIDSTTPDRQLSAAHIKLAEGTVAQAFTFAVLDNVKIRVIFEREN